jgi:predicted metal-binding membrane protein
MSTRTTLAVLTLLTVICWSWIVVMARDMYGPMTGASAWMMTPTWDATHLLLLWAMWSVMMTGMMLPTALPLVRIAGRAARHQTAEAAARESYALASGYVAAWAAFSIGATALQWTLGRLLIITPMMEAATPRVTGAFLVLAGAYQWTPLKHACLSTCQSPLDFVARRWRSGAWGAFRLGAEHGGYCIGCCWALMLLLFAGGVMNLWAIVALTLFAGFEKLVPLGVWSARISGALLIACGAWLVAR